MRNRFKGLDLIDRVPDELWMEVRDILQETGIKTIPMGCGGGSRKKGKEVAHKELWWLQRDSLMILAEYYLCSGFRKLPMPGKNQRKE